jgi:5-methylcytosine-specific restriction endonuclease McrA
MAPATAARRRALAFGLWEGEHFTAEEWLALVDFYGGRCLRCGSSENITVDHVVPLSLGGSNAIGNIQPLCEGCNGEKGLGSTDYRTLEKVG